MRKEFNMMLVIVVCAILGIVTAAAVNLLYTQGIMIDSILGGTITISDFEFVIVLVWIITGIIIGVLKN